MTRHIHNQLPQGQYVMVGNPDVGYSGAMIPGDVNYDPTSAEIAPFISVADDRISPLMQALIDDDALGNSVSTATPTRVANFQATAAAGSVALAWTTPLDGTIRTLRIVRKLASAPTTPADGTTVLTLVGASQVVLGGNQTYNDVPPTADTYHYAIFVYDANGGINLTVDGANTCSGAALFPPGVVTGMTTTTLTSGVRLNWTNPIANPLIVKIYRRIGGPTRLDSVGTNLNGGTLLVSYTNPDGHAVSGAAVTYTDATAVDAQVYHYTIFTAQGAIFNTAGVDVLGTRDNVPGNATSFTASSGNTGSVTLGWNNPTNLDLSSFRVFRKVGADPTIDATGATTNAATTVATLAASPGATVAYTDTIVAGTYHYAVFMKDSAGQWNTTGVAATGTSA